MSHGQIPKHNVKGLDGCVRKLCRYHICVSLIFYSFSASGTTLCPEGLPGYSILIYISTALCLGKASSKLTAEQSVHSAQGHEQA